MSLLSLPRELQLLIIGLLPVRDLLRLSETCHTLKDLARDPSLWKKLVLSYKNIKNNTKACREHVARCSKLRELTIHPDPETNIIRSDKIISVVMKAKRTLTTLSVIDLALSNSSFEKISQITQLTKLEINALKIQSGSVLENGLYHLKYLSKLKSLKICKLQGDLYGPGRFRLFNNVVYSLSLKQLEEVELMGQRGNQKWIGKKSIFKAFPPVARQMSNKVARFIRK